MNYVNNSAPSAYIVNSQDRGRKKIYLNSKIYLEDNKEFMVELFNPTQDSILAKININGKPASNNGLILRPGERFYLDCFIEDKKKFVFKTYNVDNTTESAFAIANNGYVEVSFFKEKTKYYNTNIGCGNITWIIDPNTFTIPYTTYTNPNPNHWGINTVSNPLNGSITTNNTGGLGGGINSCYSSTSGSFGTNANLTSCSTFNKTTIGSTKSIETGRIEKGNVSSQKFESVSMEFEAYCINRISYQLLPESKRPVETSEMKKNKFCPNCGIRIDKKFCGECGTKA